MAFTNTKENGLESLIVKWLVEQNGYEEGTNADYNKEYAVDETRLFRFLQDTQPKEMDKLGVFISDTKKRQFLNRGNGFDVHPRAQSYRHQTGRGLGLGGAATRLAGVGEHFADALFVVIDGDVQVAAADGDFFGQAHGHVGPRDAITARAVPQPPAPQTAI